MDIARENPRADYPRDIHDPRLAPRLLDLHRAMEFEELWHAGIGLLEATMPNRYFLAALPCVGVVPFFLRTTIPIPDTPDYWGRFVEADPPLSKIVRDHPGLTLAYLSDHTTWEDMVETRFYKEFVEPSGWRHAMGLLFWDGTTFYGQFSCLRTAEQGDYNTSEQMMFASLHPHLDAAVKRIARLDRERSRAVSSDFSVAG